MSQFQIDIEKQLSQLGKDIQQFVERMTTAPQEGDFKPDCDIAESETSFKIWVDLPGLSKKEVHVSLNGLVLTVEGERELTLEDGDELKREERKQGRFVRSFAVPASIEADSVKARFKNGVLAIEIDKKADRASDGSSIPIQ
ncbi:MAG: Hsp20/alpha crystallin family protein [Balneolaceae bacterium]